MRPQAQQQYQFFLAQYQLFLFRNFIHLHYLWRFSCFVQIAGENLESPCRSQKGTKYNSQELDKESDLYFFNARHYDPEIARFVTADTVIDGEARISGWNKFMYVSGNPIAFKDPTGNKKDCAGCFGNVTIKKGKNLGSDEDVKTTIELYKELREGPLREMLLDLETNGKAVNIQVNSKDVICKNKNCDSKSVVQRAGIKMDLTNAVEPGNGQPNRNADGKPGKGAIANVRFIPKARGNLKSPKGTTKVPRDPLASLAHELFHAYQITNGKRSPTPKVVEAEATRTENIVRRGKGLKSREYYGDAKVEGTVKNWTEAKNQGVVPSGIPAD